MKVEDANKCFNKRVYFDTGQYNFDGTTIKEYIFNGYIVRKNNNSSIYYQAELKERKTSRSVMLVALEKVITEI